MPAPRSRETAEEAGACGARGGRDGRKMATATIALVSEPPTAAGGPRLLGAGLLPGQCAEGPRRRGGLPGPRAESLQPWGARGGGGAGARRRRARGCSFRPVDSSFRRRGWWAGPAPALGRWRAVRPRSRRPLPECAPARWSGRAGLGFRRCSARKRGRGGRPPSSHVSGHSLCPTLCGSLWSAVRNQAEAVTASVCGLVAPVTAYPPGAWCWAAEGVCSGCVGAQRSPSLLRSARLRRRRGCRKR